MVTHGHILVNGKRINIPSYSLSVGDSIALNEKAKNVELFRNYFLQNARFTLPYLSKNEAAFSGVLERMPTREEVPIQIRDHLVIEYYSKII